jgi:hypothetical protein
MSRVQCPLFNKVAFSQVDKTITLKPTERFEAIRTFVDSGAIEHRYCPDIGLWTLDLLRE